jgi:hypothetical protein
VNLLNTYADDPGSIYYIAADVEENYQRTWRYGNKPVYAYARCRSGRRRSGDDGWGDILGAGDVRVYSILCGSDTRRRGGLGTDEHASM